jgi:exodeoxyribonuclease VII large subunit
VARAIFASNIPVVSAIGHETDFTIADFVADVRAPTPSAAAELIVPKKVDLFRRMRELTAIARSRILERIQLLKERISQLSGRLIDPGRQLADYRLQLDDRLGMMLRGLTRQLEDGANRLQVIQERLARCSPQFVAREANISLQYNHQSILSRMQFFIESRRAMFTAAVAKLHALSPLAILRRGYSMARALPDYTLVKDVRQVNMGQHVEVTLSKGAMVCRIERKI